MSSRELRYFIKERLRRDASMLVDKLTSDYYITLTNERNLGEDVELSELLYEVIQNFNWKKLNVTPDYVHNKVGIVVQCNFKNITLHNNYPRKVSFYSVNKRGDRFDPIQGESIVVKYDNEKFEFKNQYLNLDIGFLALDRIEINASIDRLDVEDVFVRDISFSSPNELKKIKVPTISIGGDVKKITIGATEFDSANFYYFNSKNHQNRPERSRNVSFSKIKGKTVKFSSELANVSFEVEQSELSEEIIYRCVNTRRFSISDTYAKSIIVTGKERLYTMSEIAITLSEFETVKFIELSDIQSIKILKSNIVENLSFKRAIFRSIESGEFEIVETVMKKMFLIYCKIPNRLVVYDQSIARLEFIFTDEPTQIETSKYAKGTTEKEKKIRAKRSEVLLYQQIKLSYEKVGNRDKSAYYRAKELTAKQLNSYRERKYGLDLIDPITLTLNRFSNYFSQNWGYTILVGLIYGFASYGLFLSTIGYKLTWPVSTRDLDKFWSLLPSVTDFVLPGFLHPSKDKMHLLHQSFGVPKEWGKLSFCTRLLIFVNDILVIPYLIYQGISAFRKHGSK